MSETDFQIARSWATEPLFYRASAPPGMTPYAYQLAGVEYHLARDHALFGDAPGLGKSAECVLLGNAIEAKRTLVVCPASLRLNWQREIWMWSTIPGAEVYVVTKAKDGISDRADYVVISYDLLRNPDILAAILALRWDHLILDEAHYLKDPRGNKRTKAICAPDGLPSVCGRITMASGTLLPNQPVECYNAIRLLHWDAIDRASLEDFRNYYYEYGEGFVYGRYQKGGHWTYGSHWSRHVRNVPRRLDDLRWRLRKHLMVRRIKGQQGVLDQLPALQWHVFPLVETAAMRKALKHPGWKKAERMYEMDADAFKTGLPVDGAISTARRLLGEAKAPAVVEYVRQLMSEGVEKLVVGAYHLSVLAYMREELADYGLVYMDGSTSLKAKQRAVDDFQEDKSISIILGQMLPLGEGWTLTAAQDVILAEPFWVPGKNDQLLERTHRIGQKGEHVTGHVPVVPDSLDERILNVVIEKARNIHEALDGE